MTLKHKMLLLTIQIILVAIQIVYEVPAMVIPTLAIMFLILMG